MQDVEAAVMLAPVMMLPGCFSQKDVSSLRTFQLARVVSHTGPRAPGASLPLMAMVAILHCRTADAGHALSAMRAKNDVLRDVVLRDDEHSTLTLLNDFKQSAEFYGRATQRCAHGGWAHGVGHTAGFIIHLMSVLFCRLLHVGTWVTHVK
jgi:hypothetical protein